MTALAPLCPLLGPICLLYMIIVVPMLRWLLVFGYRPAFDGGGDKWPKLHHMIVTSLLLGQVSLALECGFAETEKENPSSGLVCDCFCFVGSTKRNQFVFASLFSGNNSHHPRSEAKCMGGFFHCTFYHPDGPVQQHYFGKVLASLSRRRPVANQSDVLPIW